MRIRIGARGSRLAVAQAMEVAGMLEKHYPGIAMDIVRIRTSGDRIDRDPWILGEPGVFTKEIDLELLRGSIDLAVHSLKDVPTSIHEDLVIAAITPRISRREALIPGSMDSIEKIPSGSVIGTSSMRRISHLLYHRRDISVRRIRGNIDTRIGKIGPGIDAIILAEAGLLRIGYRDYIAIKPEIITPQAGQGALAVVARRGSQAARIASVLDDPISRFEADIERGILRSIGAGCRAPLGVTAIHSGSSTRVILSMISPDYDSRLYIDEIFEGWNAREIANDIMRKFESMGGYGLAREWARKLEGGSIDGDL
jgi:hydroxymethylbilane synthase